MRERPASDLLWHIEERYRQCDGYELDDYFNANHLFRSIEPGFVDFLREKRQEVVTLLEDAGQRARVVAAMAEATKIYTWQRNQYVMLPARSDALLVGIYNALVDVSRRALGEARDRAAIALSMSQVLEDHHRRLRSFFAAVCGPESADGPDPAMLRRVPCDEYTPELQIRLLAIEPATLAEPVLDLGCGSKGALVRHLLDAGIDAYGADRLAPSEARFTRADWLDIPFDRVRWGTILAHQSFSLHFLFHHQHGGSAAKTFAAASMRILDALEAGGRFCYTPSLPFFESLLEKHGAYNIRVFPHETLPGMAGQRHEGNQRIHATTHILRRE